MIKFSIHKREKIISEDGYVLVKVPEHPKSFNGWYYEHRIIAEQHFDRPLKDWETIHHINGDKTDNRMINLFVCSDYEHKKAHRN